MTTPEEYDSLGQQVAIHSAVNQNPKANPAQQYYVEEKEKGIAEAQLEVENTLDKLNHMLKQDVYIHDDNTQKMEWRNIKDKKKRVFTEEGVEKIMQSMRFYINKENLLSNFNEVQINRIMLTFRLALNGNFFMKYNTIFRQPTLEECKEILNKRLKEQKDIKLYACEIAGEEADEDEINAALMREIEGRIEGELAKIREEKLKENLREWELTFEQLSQMVLATLNRAWKGEERGSLRRHTNISEVIGNTSSKPQQEGGRFGWLRG